MEHLNRLERVPVEILAEQIELREQVVRERDDVAADLARLDPSSFTVIADVSSLPAGTHTVQLSANLPQGLSVVSISPPQVSIDVGLPLPSPSPTPAPTPTPPAPSPSP